MCLLCDQARDQRFQGSHSSGRSAFVGLSIAPAELLDESNVTATRQATATDSFLDYYLNIPGGSVSVSGGGISQQTILSLSISKEDQDFLILWCVVSIALSIWTFVK